MEDSVPKEKIQNPINIVIEQVGNGYFIRSNEGVCTPSKDFKVFQSKAELFKFLEEHFTFTNEKLTPDEKR